MQHRQELLVLNRCRAPACIPSQRTFFLLSAVGRAGVLRSLPRPPASLSPAPLPDGTLQKLFMTRALWGVGSTSPYGHDDRSINLRHVILGHGGEAQVARDDSINYRIR